MNIGIDARVLTYQHYTGLRTYAKNLVWALSKIDKQNQYLLFSPQKIKIPLAKNFSLYLVPNPFFKLRRILWEQVILPLVVKKTKVDLLHALVGTGPIFSPVPLVLTVHDLRFFNKEYQRAKLPAKYTVNDCYQKKIIPLLVKRAKAVICPSDFTSTQVRKFTQKLSVKTVYHGIDPFWKRIEDVKKEQAFLFITDYSPTKNTQRTLRAFRKFLNSFPNFKLAIVASDRLGLAKTRELVAKLKLQSNTEIFPQPPTETLLFLYNKALAFLVPSTLEGFGLPVLEAQACGCPVIASKTASLPEIAGEAALFLNPYSIGDMVQKMREIAKDRVLRKDLIKKGFENIRRFSWEKTARQTLEIYKQAIG